jgi:RNA polymerase sigma-70 factor (ECF subfamily)
MFRTTRWSLVARSRGEGDDSRRALDALCRSYRPPVVAHLRARGYSAADAEDLAQGFFERFLEQRFHQRVDPGIGRFRVFLRAALDNFCVNMREHAGAQRRGGGSPPLPIDSAGEIPADPVLDPEHAFERSWALTVVDRALAALRDEAIAQRRGELFDALAGYLADTEPRDYAETGRLLGLRANTVAVAVSRLRRRLQQLVRAELGDTVADAADVEDELGRLRAALGIDG